MAAGTEVRRRVERETMCAVYARGCGEPALGHTGFPFAYLLFELPLPWPARIFETSDDLRALQALRMRLYTAGFLFGAVGLAPDDAYSRPGLTRVVALRRPGGAFVRFERTEYLLPAGQPLTPLAAALFDPDPAGRPTGIDRYRVANREGRDLLVCTHGSVDLCCATFGYPAYRSLRQRLAGEDGVRVWRASHFGGHRFAPTVLDLPEGRSWAFVNDDVIEQIVRRSGPVERVLPHYRGWTGLDSVWAQIAEGEAFRREGWRWLDYDKAATVAEIAADGDSARVRLEFVDPVSGAGGTYEAVVEVSGVRSLPLCGERPEEAHNEGKDYRVAWMRRLEG